MSTENSISKAKFSEWGLLKIIEKEQILDECIKDMKEPSSEEKNLILKTWLQNQGINKPENLNNWLKQEKINEAQWQQIIIRRWKWMNWCKEEFADKVESYYLKRKNQIDKVTYSLLRVKDKDLADELYLRIKSGEASFQETASLFSEGPEKKLGGEIGPVPLNQPHPLLSKLLLISKSKQLWAPKKLDNWWIIVRLESIINTELNEELRTKLLYEMGENFLLKSNFNNSIKKESINNLDGQKSNEK